MDETHPRTSPALQGWSRFLVGATLLLLFAGANVTTTRSGDAVPTWPEPFWPHDPTLPAVIELSHRYAVPMVAVAAVVVAWLARKDERPAVRKVAWIGAGLVAAQAALGGVRVLLVSKGIAENPAWIKVLHAGVAETFFCVAAALATVFSPAWRAAKRRPLDAGGMSAIRMSALGVLLLFTQALLGALARHGAAPREVHALFALPTLAIVARLVLVGGWDVPQDATEIRRPAALLGVLAAAQLALGLVTYFVAASGVLPEKRDAAQVVLMNLHLAVGAAMLGMTLSILMRSVRVFGLPTDERLAAGERVVSVETAAPPRVELGVGRRLLDVLALTKPRLNALTVFAVAAGWTAAVGRSGDPRVFAATVAGSALVAGGASALNQYAERGRDALMKRTADRPLPAGRMAPRDGLVVGLAMAAAGLAALALATNALTVGLALLCLLWYVAIYTPLKTRTSLNTIAGTIPGALPPVMGVAAATGRLGVEAFFLFSLMVAWQLPHFLSIAWIYRDDYERAGYVMLPSVEGGEAQTARQVVVQSLLTVVVSLVAVPFHLAGRDYLLVAFGAGIVLLGAGTAFALARTDDSARRLLRVSILHLPVVLTAFALDRV